MKTDVADTKLWFETEGLDAADYHDVIAFKVGHVLGNKVASDAIDADLVRYLCEKDSVVHFIKITKRLPKPGSVESAPYNTMTYTYRIDNRTANKLLTDTTTYFNQVDVCKYMPTNVVVPAGDITDYTGDDVLLGREAESGKYVCDYIDSVNPITLQSNLRGLPIAYEENKESLPVINQIVTIPDYVARTLSLIASISDGLYKHDNAHRAFNGVVVTPTLVMYNQIINLNLTTTKY